MALKLKYTDEHGILHINMSPTSTPRVDPEEKSEKAESIVDPKFDTINNRFGQYDLFGGKYEGGESLFRSRYNSIEEELANTPYAFTAERSVRLNSANSPLLDITINSRLDEPSPSKDIEDDRFFRNRYDGLFGPQIDFQTSIKTSDEDETPAFTVTQLIHAQDRYFDLSSRHSTSSVVNSPKSDRNKTEVRTSANRGSARAVSEGRGGEGSVRDGAFRVLSSEVKTLQSEGKTLPPAQESVVKLPTVPTAKRKREKSFAIITETPAASRPASPRSLPVEIRTERRSPFRGRGFRVETSRHSTPRASAANSRANSPLRRRTSSLSRIDKMATATLPPPIPHSLSRPHSPRNFVKQNIEEVRELSELNREKHEVEAEKKRKEEEEALLKEMGLFEKNAKSDAIRSIVCSRTNSRSNSPSKARLRSRSTSPSAQAPPAIIHFENIPADKEYVNGDDGMPIPPVRASRVRATKSQPQSNDGSPKHSKIPKRQNSVSPTRNERRNTMSNRRVENNLTKNQRFISNSTSSIHETIRIGGQAHDKRGMSKSTQYLNISPKHIKGKPPISPGRVGPPPSNKYINPKRLSPIVGTPNKSPIEDSKPASARTPTKPSSVARKPVKTAGSTPVTSRLNSRQPSRAASRDPSPDKRRTVTKSSLSKSTTNLAKTRPASRAVSTRTPQKPSMTTKPDPKKPINRTSSMKSLTKTPSMKNLNEKPPILKKRDSNKDLTQSTNKVNDVGTKKETDNSRKSPVKMDSGKDTIDRRSAKKDKVDPKPNKEPMKEMKEEVKKTNETSTTADEVMTQDNETQYDRITNDKGELVILTKKNIVSMTTAAITAQPLEVVTTVTNQLPAALEKAREKGMFERHSSKDSLAPKDDDKEVNADTKESSKPEVKDKSDEDKKPVKPERTVFAEDNVKMKPLLPPYNNPQVERVKQKIDNILKSPEVSSETIVMTAPVKPNETVTKSMTSFKSIADKTKNDIKQAKDGVATKLTNLKDDIVKQNEKTAADIRKEASKIVDSIITPVEEPKDVMEKAKEGVKKEIEPIVMVVNEKKKNLNKNEIVEKMTETLVKGDAEVEVQSSNVSTPGKMGALNRVLASKMAESDSDKSQSNGGFPQSTSTTPRPPARVNRPQKEGSDGKSSNDATKESSPETSGKRPNICQRLMGKCKTKCCPCCIKPEDDEKEKALTPPPQEKKGGMMNKLNCFKRKGDGDIAERAISHEDIERAAGKAASIDYENETKRKRKLRDILCGCCGSSRRVSSVADPLPRDVTPEVVGGGGCCGGRRGVERRDSILSDRPSASLCNNRLFTWARGACRRHQSEHLSQTASRRQSLFSKNKSLSPTLPPEDTRVKLDPSLVEHTSVIRGAIPVLPVALAYCCLVCNVLIPGLGTILSGIFCLCFGIPRFGVHDSAKHRIGSFLINLLVGCGQLFTVLFCLVGWGWSIWWGVIMLKISRKYRKLKAEAAAGEAEAPPVTANNHTRA